MASISNTNNTKPHHTLSGNLNRNNTMIYTPNNINRVLYSDNKSLHDEDPKIMTKHCIEWATKYFANTPYLYEISDDTIYHKQTVKLRKTKKHIHGTVSSNTSNKKLNTMSRSVNRNRTSNSQGIDFKFSINEDIYNILDSTIHASTTALNSNASNTNAVTRTKTRQTTLNKFVKTTQFLLRYSLYLIKFIENTDKAKANDKGKPIKPYNNFIEFINSNPEFRDELSELRRANAYELPIKYKNDFYDKFILTAINAYNTADDFIKLGGTTYLTSMHGRPITISLKNKFFFKVPKNCKIALLTPLNTYGIVTFNTKAAHDLSYLAKDVGYNNIIKLGPNYYQNINNNVPFQLLNMNIYHEGQMVPNLSLSFSFNIIIGTADKKNEEIYKQDGFLKYNDNEIESATSVMHYFYNMLIKMFIKNELKNSNYTKKIFTYKNENNIATIKNNIFFQPDKLHSSLYMILQDVSIFSTEKQNYISDIFTNSGLTNVKNDDKKQQIIDEIKSIINKTINILSKLNITNESQKLISNISTIIVNIEMDKYIDIMNSELTNYNNNQVYGGNLYLFNACRHYSNRIDRLIPAHNINYQLAMTYVTNIVNKYISSLINTKPLLIDMKDYKGNLYASHSMSSKVCNKRDINQLDTKPNTMYYIIALDISKDYMILLAISNFIINSVYYQSSYISNFKAIKIVLYNLFIKPKRKDNFILSYSKTKYIKDRIKHIPKENIKNKVMHIIRSKSYTYTPDDMNIIIKKITQYIMQYYLPYLKWINNNSVLRLEKWNDTTLNNNTQKLNTPLHLACYSNVYDTLFTLGNTIK